MTALQAEGSALESDHDRSTYHVSISDENFVPKDFVFDDRKPTGAQIAEAFGARPVQEFVVLRHLKSGELETLRPTETTDLGDEGVEQFFVIRGSETYRFTIEGLSMEWPLGKISGKHAKMLARVDPDIALFLDLPSGDREIKNEEEVDLRQPGVEELRIRRLVTVIYNQDQRFQLEPRIYTTEELMRKFSVPEGYKLDLYTDRGGLRELKPHEEVHIREGMEFVSHPPVGQSS